MWSSSLELPQLGLQWFEACINDRSSRYVFRVKHLLAVSNIRLFRRIHHWLFQYWLIFCWWFWPGNVFWALTLFLLCSWQDFYTAVFFLFQICLFLPAMTHIFIWIIAIGVSLIFHLFFAIISHKARVSLTHLLSSLIFTHNKLFDASINNMQEYALVYNCSSWVLIVDCHINPRTGSYRYYDYIGGFLHLCFADFFLHMLIIFVQYSCRHCFWNCRWTIGNVFSFEIL